MCDLALTPFLLTCRFQDANSKHMYKLLNNTDVFTIENKTGTIRVRDSMKLDRELQELYYVLVIIRNINYFNKRILTMLSTNDNQKSINSY